MAKHVAPKFTRKKVTSLDRLQLADYTHILLSNYTEDGEHECGVLFDRFVVERGLDRDIRYCQELRHKYAHLAGMNQPVPIKEQFSDLVIIQRTVRELTRDRSTDAADEEFTARLARVITRLVGDVAEVVDPEHFDREETGFSDAQLAALRSVVAEVVTGSAAESRLGPAPDDAVAKSIDELRQVKRSVFDSARDLNALKEYVGSILIALAERSPQPQASDEPQPAPVEPREPAGPRAAPANRVVRRLSIEEAREHLMTLRRRMWADTGTEATSDGLLRKSMIDAFLRYRPTSEADLDRTHMRALISAVPSIQRQYLQNVFEIIARLE